MKTTRTFLYTILAGAFALALIAGGAFWGRPVQAQTTVDDLTGEEIDGLLYMIEEEKLARDVYLMLDEQWDLRVLENISRAEQTHMDSVARVLSAHDIDNPALNSEIGEFTNPELQALYDDLIAAGSQSVADALRVGLTIEETDILDLQAYVADTDEADIQQLYTNLLKGSSNHLRAFVSNLERRTGETVQPQYLDAQTHDEIMNDGNARSNRNRGANRFRQ